MKSRFIKNKKPPGLMLTSLLDMFTIILIFLIVSFEAEDYDFRLNPELKLPESNARSVFKPAVNVAITPNSITVESDVIVPLKEGKAEQAQYDAGEIKPLVDVLRKRFETLDAKAKAGTLDVADGEDPTVILVQADKALDYKTLYLVLRSASIAGFVRYRLAVMKN